jgi:putative ABC transport system permease protein
VLGILLGILLGRGAVELVSQTINDVFFTLTVREVSLPGQSLVKGALLGVAATVLATIVPAWEAAKSPPRNTLSRAQLESFSGRLVSLAAGAGLLAAVASGLVLASFPLNLPASFAFTFGVVIGLALMTPWVTRAIVPGAAWLLSRLFGPAGRMAPREVSGSASRTSVAMAALMVAVAVAIGVSLMVSSFRGSVKIWLDQILSNDIYASVAGASLAEPMVAIDPEAIELARSWPGAAALHLLRNVQVESPYGPITVAANNNPNDGNEQVYVEAVGSGDEVWEAVQAGAVMISEPLSNRLDLHLDDEIELVTDQGPRLFPIVAVFRDYTSSQGNVTMWLETYRALWDDPAVTAFSIEAAPGADVDGMVSQMKAELNPLQLLNIRSNLALRAESLEVFDRTFTITRALQLITTAVAFVGVLSAMLALQLEKQRQMAILKAIGMTARQLWTLILLETGLIGFVAGLLALPTGYAVALILIEVINRRSFGWTMQMQLEPGPFLQALAIALGAALLAGIYPAYRISRRNTAESIRFD